MANDLPATGQVTTTALGLPVYGFQVRGDDALAWWHRLRDRHPHTGQWPVLMPPQVPAGFAGERYQYRTPQEEAARSNTLDGAALLAGWGEDRLTRYGNQGYAEQLRAELRGDGEWRPRPEPPGFGVPDTDDDVMVALLPVAASWQVPLALHYGGWNEYPTPAEHAAILRYFHSRYGAELAAGLARVVGLGRPDQNHQW